jgi:hypothetical protein
VPNPFIRPERSELGIVSRITQFFTWPFRAIGNALEFRRLRRRWPYVHRRLMSTTHGTRTETDAEYLARLREVDFERHGE